MNYMIKKIDKKYHPSNVLQLMYFNVTLQKHLKFMIFNKQQEWISIKFYKKLRNRTRKLYSYLTTGIENSRSCS